MPVPFPLPAICRSQDAVRSVPVMADLSVRHNPKRGSELDVQKIDNSRGPAANSLSRVLRAGLFIVGGVLGSVAIVWLARLAWMHWDALLQIAKAAISNIWIVAAAVGAVGGCLAWLRSERMRRSGYSEQRRSVGRANWAIAGVAAALALVLAIWLLPVAIVDWDAIATGATASERLAAIATARQALLWAAGGLLAILTITLTWRRDATARLSAERERDENYTGRYTTAIAELGDDKLAVRLGGIYALERIAADSTRDRQTILDVLVAYIVDSSPLVSGSVGDVASDVSAAVRVVGRITRLSPPDRPIYLGFLRLDASELPGANLEGVTLHQTTLCRSEMSGVNLRKAWMHGTDFGGATLKDSDMAGASLYHAKLMGADLRNVNLAGARLEGADLFNANLEGANLTGANLSDANLLDARVHRRDLVDVRINTGTTNPRDAETGREIDMQALAEETSDAR